MARASPSVVFLLEPRVVRVSASGITRRVPERRVWARDESGINAPNSRGAWERVRPPFGVCFIFLDSSRRVLAPGMLKIGFRGIRFLGSFVTILCFSEKRTTWL